MAEKIYKIEFTDEFMNDDDENIEYWETAEVGRGGDLLLSGRVINGYEVYTTDVDDVDVERELWIVNAKCWIKTEVIHL